MKTSKKVLLLLLMSLIGISTLIAQEDLNILYTLDLGLPPSGLNVPRVGGNISVLGDINGDGYDDWATRGGAEYESGSGFSSVHIFLGGSERRDSETPADIVFYGNEDMMLGQGTWKAGDVNADGFDDILIFGSGLDEDTGEFVPTHGLYFGGDPFNTEADILFQKLDIHPGTANYSSDAGDVNNDGYDDILLSIYTPIGGLDTAHVYLYYGGESMDNIPDVIFSGTVFPPGPGSGARKFWGATAAGDVNNDSFDDIIISTYQGGKLYFGGENMNTDQDVLFDDFRGAGIGTGPYVADAGDVNNDGYADILMTANVASSKAFICYGDSLIDSTPDVIIPMWRDEIGVGLSATSTGDLNNDDFDDILLGTSTLWSIEQGQARVFYGGTVMDSIADIYLDGPEPWSVFGYAVAGGGDFDGDGDPDFLIGDIGNASSLNQHDDAGSISLFYGGETVSNSADAVFTGVADMEGFGSSVAHAGDVNNDGYPDIIVGASQHWEAPYHYAGRAYLYYGGETYNNTPDLIFNTTFVYNGYHAFFGKKVRSAGDVNNDGFDDIYIEEQFKVSIFLGGTPMDSIADYVFNMSVSDYSFSAVGDVNNDDYDDILYGKPSQGTAGTSYLYLGGENLLDGVDVIFEGETTGDNLGKNVSTAGDLNSDGFADFMINVPGDDTNGADAGAVMVFFGDTTISNTADLTIYSNYNGPSYTGINISGGGDINNDEFDDIVIGDGFFSLTSSSYEGRIYIYYGGSEMDNTVDVIFTGDSVGMHLGKKTMLLTDMNSDRFDELLTNKGHFINGEEFTSIYYGAAAMDTIPDIILPYFVDYSDYGAFRASDNTVRFLVGDQMNNAAGLDMGRVIVYTNSITNIIETGQMGAKPTRFLLNQNYPNPFNPMTAIGYRLSTVSNVELSIFDILGRKVATLVNERQQAGSYQVEWDASGFASGVYYYKLKTSEFEDVKKMILLR